MPTLNDKMTALADACRKRFKTTDKLSLDDMIKLVTPPAMPNLVANTDKDISIDGTGNSWALWQTDIGTGWNVGDEISISGDFNMVGKATDVEIKLFDQNLANQRSDSLFIPVGKGQSSSIQIKNMAGTGDMKLVFYAGHAGGTLGNVLTIHHLMVNRGSVASPWTKETSIGGVISLPLPTFSMIGGVAA